MDINSILLIDTENEEGVIYDTTQVFSFLDVHGIVRIHQKEYPTSLEKNDLLTHFNIWKIRQLLHLRLIFARILRSWIDINREQGLVKTPPLLSLRDVYVAECIESEPIEWTHLNSDHFCHSFQHIHSVSELQNAFRLRYMKSLPHISEEEMWKQWLVCSRFRIIDKMSCVSQSSILHRE